MALQRRNKVSAEFSMSSLTDIIFLLLIFFMLTSTLVSPNALNLKLPSSSSKAVAPAQIAVSIQKKGGYSLYGEKMNAAGIESAVRKKVKQMDSSKDLTLTIVAERGVPIEQVVTIMDMAYRMKVNAILATESMD